MEPNFYENIIPNEDKEKCELIKKMNKLLDESIESFLLLRQREERETNNNSKEKSSKNSESSQNREMPVSFLEYID